MTDTEQIEVKIREKLVGVVLPKKEQKAAREINELAQIIIQSYLIKKRVLP